MAPTPEQWWARQFASLEQAFKAGNGIAALEAILRARDGDVAPPRWAIDAVVAWAAMGMGADIDASKRPRYRGKAAGRGRTGSIFSQFKADAIDGMRADAFRNSRELQERVGKNRVRIALVENHRPGAFAPQRKAVGRTREDAFHHAEMVMRGRSGDAGLPDIPILDPWPKLSLLAAASGDTIKKSTQRKIDWGGEFPSATLEYLDQIGAFDHSKARAPETLPKRTSKTRLRKARD